MVSRPPTSQSFVDSTATLASLYQAPLGEFTARRTALVAQLKRSGHKEVAARIAAAAKPSRAAHLVNQVFWRARAIYDAVLDAGTAARAAQQARLLGDTATDLNETLRDRDEAVRAAVEAAVGAAAEGQGASDAVAAQLRASFEALAAHGLEGRLAHGHLTADVALPGLAAFAGLVLPASTGFAGSRPTIRGGRASSRAREAARVGDPAAGPAHRRDRGLHRAAARAPRRCVERVEDLRRSTAAAHEVVTTAEHAAADAARKAVEARQAVERAASRAACADLPRRRRIGAFSALALHGPLSGAEAQLRRPAAQAQ